VEEIISWAKEHPYLLGSVVVGIIVLYFVLSSGSSASSQQAAAAELAATGGLSEQDYAALQNAQLQSSTQIQGAQIQSATTLGQASDQLSAVQIAAAAQDTQAQLQQQVDLNNIAAGAAVTQNTNDTNLQIAQAQIGGQVQVAQIGATQNETISGQQQQTLQDQIAASVASQTAIANAQSQQTSSLASVFNNLTSFLTSYQNQSAGVSSANVNTTPTPVASVPAPSVAQSLFGGFTPYSNNLNGGAVSPHGTSTPATPTFSANVPVGPSPGLSGGSDVNGFFVANSGSL
jgi:hypothetical protein